MNNIPAGHIDDINKWLKEKYGMFDQTNQNFRVVWSEDLYEKRDGHWDEYSPEGLFIRSSDGVKEVPKYSYIHEKFILERIIPNEKFNRTDMVDKYSYEPIWTFRDKNNNALIPQIAVCYYVIETLLENIAKKVGVKYKNPFNDPKIAPEVKREKQKEMYELLYGEETPVTDALAFGRGVTVPELPAKENENEHSIKPASTH